MRKRVLLPILLLLTAVPLMAAPARPAWPSLKNQLERVPAGSPLAQLIAANQEFQLLRPEEANDDISIPLWLRVKFRKDHPDNDYLASDPTGGYPLVLREAYEWMLHHPDLKPVDVEPLAKAQGSKGTSVGPNIRISGEQLHSRAESDIRVNYWDPSRIVGSSNNLRGAGTMAMFYSSDGGATWGQTSLRRDAVDEYQSDPAVDWTSDGTAWTVAIGVNTAPFELRMRAWKSTDGGATWESDGVASGEQTLTDKQMMWVDHSSRSPYKDNIYISYHDGREVYVNRRTPGADGAWGDPVRVSFGETTGTGIGGDIKTDQAGNVYVFWPDTGSRKIYFVKSTDGGRNFSRPAVLASTYQAFNSDLPAMHNRAALVYVTAGAFQVGKKTNVYAAWMDLSGAPGCRTPADDPRTNVNSTCKSRIWFSRSTNGGQKWTKPRMINNQSGRNDQFNPWMVVDEATGALGIIYYDTVGEDRKRVNVFFQPSFNAGSSWGTPVRVSSASSESSDPDDDFQFGDYNAFSGIAGTFFPSWTDRRGANQPEIWTTAIRSSKSGTCKTTDLFTEKVAGGAASLSVPAGATETQLSVWHRRHFVSGENLGTLKVAIDGGLPVAVSTSAVLAGPVRASRDGDALFKGFDNSPVNTLIDLEAVCRATIGDGCAGRSLRLYFSAGSEAAATGDVWYLDDVSVTACTP